MRIFAAGSLRPGFERLVEASDAPLQISYANARDLAQRISAGEPADVYASASEEHPQRLYEAGMVEPPHPFVTNRVVVAVPEGSALHDAAELAAPGIRLVIEVAGIPLGDYTRELFARMERLAGTGFAQRAMANVAVEEQLVDAVADRLLAGEADAGVLYATDVAARAPRLRAIEVPEDAQVAATYVACVTTATSQRARAAAWVDGLVMPSAQAVLRGAGFGPPPRVSPRRRSSRRARRPAPS